MNDQPANGLSQRERAAFAELPRESKLIPEEEERAVDALRSIGLLHSPIVSAELATKKLPRPNGPGLRRVAVAIALFAGGALSGRLAAAVASSGARPGDMSVDTGQPAMSVQRAGSEFVRAIARAVDLPPTASERTRAADAAVVSLRAAAATIPLLSPTDPIALDLQQTLAANVGGANLAKGESTVIWF